MQPSNMVLLVKSVRREPAGNREVNPATGKTITGGEFAPKLSDAVGNAYKQPQTKTVEFKKWFAGSKVVDDKGNPLRVYHGMWISGLRDLAADIQRRTEPIALTDTEHAKLNYKYNERPTSKKTITKRVNARIAYHEAEIAAQPARDAQNRLATIKQASAFYHMPAEAVDELKSWPVVSKSPFGPSYYNSKGIREDYKPEGSLRIADHWGWTNSLSEQKHCELADDPGYKLGWRMAVYRNGRYQTVKVFSGGVLSKAHDVSDEPRDDAGRWTSNAVINAFYGDAVDYAESKDIKKALDAVDSRLVLLVKSPDSPHAPAGTHTVNPETGKTIVGGEFTPGTGSEVAPAMVGKVRIDSLTNWGAPKRVDTARGPRMLRTGRAGDSFWNVWRSSKDALKNAGVSCSKDPRTGAWEATWWSDIPVEEKKAEAKKVEASRATETRKKVPVPDGLAYYPYQKAGVAYAEDKPGVLIADEMGLGKTVEAIGISNADKKIKKVLVIAPASLKINWQREWQKWDTKGMSVGIANKIFPDTDVVVVNYDILSKHMADIHAKKWDMLVCDEAHFLKSEGALRTKNVLGSDKTGQKPIVATRRVFLTGTPIVNRPAELWTLVHSLDPEGLGKNFWQFHKRYTNATNNGYGWDFSGAANLVELQEKLRSRFMVRRLKADVLTDLPPKTRQVIELPVDSKDVKEYIDAQNAKAQANAEEIDLMRTYRDTAKASGDKELYATAVDKLSDLSKVAFEQMSKERHEIGLLKVPQVVEHLKQFVEHDGKCICFAHHKDVIDKIMTEFPGVSVKVTGDMDQAARQRSVDAFQDDPKCRLFVGNIQAAGVGLTLTAAHTVVFAELAWTPAEMSQAEDRAHRIGQRENVLVQHLVHDGSLDAKMAKMLVHKQSVFDQALNEKTTRDLASKPVIEEIDFTPTDSKPTNTVKYTPEQIAMLHSAMQHLASHDLDQAREQNDVGFNKMDSEFGHALAGSPTLTQKQATVAAKLSRKYRRQVGHIVVIGEGGTVAAPSEIPSPAKKPRASKIAKSLVLLVKSVPASQAPAKIPPSLGSHFDFKAADERITQELAKCAQQYEGARKDLAGHNEKMNAEAKKIEAEIAKVKPYVDGVFSGDKGLTPGRARACLDYLKLCVKLKRIRQAAILSSAATEKPGVGKLGGAIGDPAFPEKGGKSFPKSRCIIRKRSTQTQRISSQCPVAPTRSSKSK